MNATEKRKMLTRATSLLMSSTLLLVLCACTSTNDPTPEASRYRTIPAELGRNTERARLLTNQATDALNEGRLLEAEQLLRDALTADVMHGPAHNNLGQLYYKQKRYYEAAWEFQYAIRLMPHQPIPRNNLGMVFEVTGQLDQATEQYELAVAEEADNPELLGNLARARIRRGDTGSEIEELLRQIVMKDTRPEWRQWAEQRLRFIQKDAKQ